MNHKESVEDEIDDFVWSRCKVLAFDRCIKDLSMLGMWLPNFRDFKLSLSSYTYEISLDGDVKEDLTIALSPEDYGKLKTDDLNETRTLLFLAGITEDSPSVSKYALRFFNSIVVAKDYDAYLVENGSPKGYTEELMLKRCGLTFKDCE